MDRELAREIFGVVPIRVHTLCILIVASFLYEFVKVKHSIVVFALCVLLVTLYSAVTLVRVLEAREEITIDLTDQQQQSQQQTTDTAPDEMANTPDDETLLKALKALRINNPSLGRAKVIEQFRAEKGWQISDKRMKACMDANNLGAIDPKESEEAKKKAGKEKLPHLPPSPLGEQLSYSKRNKGRLILYGCGDYDYAVAPVSDMCVIIQQNQIYIADFLKIFKNKRMELHRQEYLAHQAYFKLVWDMYKRAAEIIDKSEGYEMSMEIVKRQFMAEYRVNPLLSEEEDPKTNARLKANQAAKYKKIKMEILKEMHKNQPKLVPLDAKGKPVWNEGAHGQFSMSIMAVNRFGLESKRLI